MCLNIIIFLKVGEENMQIISSYQKFVSNFDEGYTFVFFSCIFFCRLKRDLECLKIKIIYLSRMNIKFYSNNRMKKLYRFNIKGTFNRRIVLVFAVCLGLDLFIENLHNFLYVLRFSV